MKKIIFLFVALLSVITMSAKDDVTVKSGSLAEVKAAGSLLCILFGIILLLHWRARMLMRSSKKKVQIG